MNDTASDSVEEMLASSVWVKLCAVSSSHMLSLVMQTWVQFWSHEVTLSRPAILSPPGSCSVETVGVGSSSWTVPSIPSQAGLDERMVVSSSGWLFQNAVVFTMLISERSIRLM